MHCRKNEMALHLERFSDRQCEVMTKKGIHANGIIQVDKIEVARTVEAEVRGMLERELRSQDCALKDAFIVFNEREIQSRDIGKGSH